jgi:hypothetical protein
MEGRINIQTEIYAATFKHRAWMAGLKQPEGTFELVIKRLMQGDSQHAIARWLVSLNSTYSIHAYGHYLAFLNADIQTLIEAKNKELGSRMEIADYDEERRQKNIRTQGHGNHQKRLAHTS